MAKIAKTSELFDLTKSIAAPLLGNTEYPWEALPKIKAFILELGATLPSEIYEKVGEDVWIAKSAKVAPSAYIDGPTIICECAEIRHCAYIRGSVIVGEGSIVGNSCEVKNSIIFDGVQTPHYNYVGDSILGYHSHMGAGSVTSNVKSDKTNVSIMADGERIPTGLRKFGAMLGDYVEVGCNSVLCPGSVIGRNSTIYPLTRVRGYIPENSIHKGDEIVPKK
jgi:NDP-sugar pyrophosphorylase family protein